MLKESRNIPAEPHFLPPPPPGSIQVVGQGFAECRHCTVMALVGARMRMRMSHGKSGDRRDAKCMLCLWKPPHADTNYQQGDWFGGGGAVSALSVYGLRQNRNAVVSAGNAGRLLVVSEKAEPAFMKTIRKWVKVFPEEEESWNDILAGVLFVLKSLTADAQHAHARADPHSRCK